MKKYFLTALLGAFCLFGFASAETFVYNSSDYVYNPSSFTVTSDFNLTSSSLSSAVCSSSSCRLSIGDGCYISGNGSSFSVSYNGYDENYDYISLDYCPLTAGVYSISPSDGDEPFSSITLNIGNGGSSGGSSSEGILNSTGQAYLGNVISGISSVVSEFIPYMLYLGLGILVVTLGFVAVKRLMNYFTKRVTGIFSSRRRK